MDTAVRRYRERIRCRQNSLAQEDYNLLNILCKVMDVLNYFVQTLFSDFARGAESAKI